MQLNPNYRIVYDGDNTVLQFFESREKMVKDEETKKLIGTGVFKEVTENYYYPNLRTALSSFLNKSTEGAESVEQVLSRLNELQQLINTIK